MAKKSVKLNGQVIVNSIVTPQVSGTIVKADENFLTMRIRRKGSSKHEIKVFRKEDVVSIWSEEGTGFSDVSGQADVCLRSEMAKLDSYSGSLSVSDDGWFVCKGEEERVYITNPAFTKFIAEDNVPADDDEKPKKKKKPVEEDDDDEKPKKKAKKPVDDDDEEDEKPAKKKKKPPVEEDDDEDEKPKKKKKPADDDDDDDEPKKKKKKPADDDDEEDEKPKKKSKKPADDDDDDDEPKKKKGKKEEDDDNWDDD
jgi:hypothetical protein